jgi:hypothetical protein
MKWTKRAALDANKAVNTAMDKLAAGNTTPAAEGGAGAEGDADDTESDLEEVVALAPDRPVNVIDCGTHILYQCKTCMVAMDTSQRRLLKHTCAAFVPRRRAQDLAVRLMGSTTPTFGGYDRRQLPPLRADRERAKVHREEFFSPGWAARTRKGGFIATEKVATYLQVSTLWCNRP